MVVFVFFESSCTLVLQPSIVVTTHRDCDSRDAMSAFKRRTPSKQVALPPGTRACPISTSTVLTSSGIPSLDDILGGGVPLSCLLAVLAPDSQSAYGELVQKYFVAQGIARRQHVCIVYEDALSFVNECMWMPTNHPMPTVDEDDAVQEGDKIKIAWRYEQMKKFETSVTNLYVPVHI